MYADNRDSLSATELVSSFLMNEVHVPVVIGPVYLAWLTLRLTTQYSDAIISTAGGMFDESFLQWSDMVCCWR